jgi:prepilin-type N-terminal cleavage/methylation domain-containing protein
VRARRHKPGRKTESGFSLIESLIGITLLGIVLIGLSQVFLIGIKNNKNAGEIGVASFLARQMIDQLRAMTAEELNAFPAVERGEKDDEILDLNGDAVPDYRRITQLESDGLSYDVQVFVFSASRVGASRSALLRNPWQKGVRAVLRTMISR